MKYLLLLIGVSLALAQGPIAAVPGRASRVTAPVGGITVQSIKPFDPLSKLFIDQQLGVANPGSTRKDEVHCVGYNVNCGSLRDNTADHSFAWYIENYYAPVNDAGAQLEAYWQWVDPAGVNFRPLALVIQRNTNATQIDFRTDTLNILDRTTNTQKVQLYSATTGGMTLFGGPLDFDTNNVAAVRQFNAARDGHINLIGLDASNVVQLGGSGSAGVAVTGQSFTALGAVTIGATLASSLINQGADTMSQNDATSNAGLFTLRKSRGTYGSPTVVTTADLLGNIYASGHDGTSYINSASIVVGTQGTIATNRMPSYMAFSTSTDAAPSVLTERMRINASGQVSVGTPNLTNKRFTVAGLQNANEIYSYDTNISSGLIMQQNDSSGYLYTTGATNLGFGTNGGIDTLTLTNSTNLATFKAGVQVNANLQAASYSTATNCSNAASPSVCGSAAAGAVAIPTGTVSVTLVVNTTAVTANSRISIESDDSLTIAATTCNSTLATLVGGMAVTARTAGTSFTITYSGTIATNPLCVSYSIID